MILELMPYRAGYPI
nr:ribosomal protein L22 [Fagus sylvatica]